MGMQSIHSKTVNLNDLRLKRFNLNGLSDDTHQFTRLYYWDQCSLGICESGECILLNYGGASMCVCVYQLCLFY